ncbi:MAG: hypothetical protein IPN01_03115 [Deltaproteobacteria bacterium]|nr:hypothetical protein [Deltaproteobacteria bacterium]
MLPTLLLTLACRAPAGPPPIPDPAPALELSATLAEDMGGEGLGFVHASSANGRLVVMRRWAPGVTPSFGHHGEASPEPELVLLDLRAGAERVLDEIVDVSADRRHLLVLDEGRMWRVDAETGAWEGLDADTEDDGNACLPPRGASFWSSGRHLAVIEPDAQALSVRDLSSGQTRRFPRRGPRLARRRHARWGGRLAHGGDGGQGLARTKHLLRLLVVQSFRPVLWHVRLGRAGVDAGGRGRPGRSHALGVAARGRRHGLARPQRGRLRPHPRRPRG